ncbi:tRNA (adenosine(37)-N6)-threonylcarbamoyltransferase complex transferase subunit TsaD [Candidatus Parcubacteria bacterium]|nr:tRNA (adenosine(37)-N6)-threonylcarbamoyltransferase complex transferase subunit TsaD [Candidatus Parcubacteria bacterium]
MKILGIETSCDETAVAVVESTGDIRSPSFKLLAEALYSQVETHAKYGGVFPAMAKREHAKNLVPLLRKVLDSLTPSPVKEKGLGDEAVGNLKQILDREPGLFEMTKDLLETVEKPDIDLIAVTAGPGLEPALWVGINFARALSEAWNIPLIASNHMEGHIVSPLIDSEHRVEFPALALLISGGHTELVHIKDWTEYEVIGRTRDDAVGEAFDKVARLLSLPYPGGPEISKLAEEGRQRNVVPRFALPRPMIHTKDYDFSFSGIKTSVLYTLKKIDDITPEIKTEMALEFENAVTEVLVTKTRKALEEFGAKTLILGGGVVANTYIRQEFQKLIEQHSETKLLIPDIKLSTDNAVMIAAAGYLNFLKNKNSDIELRAQGNLSLGARK